MKAVLVLTLILFMFTGVRAEETAAPAPDFNVQITDSTTVRLSDYKGRVVLVDFWASWCKPCKDEFPYLIELYRENQERGLEIIAVNLDKKIEKALGFLGNLDTEVPFPVVYDPEGTIPPLYSVKGMPTTVLVDKSGLIRFQHIGFSESSKETYEQELEILLGETYAAPALEESEDED